MNHPVQQQKFSSARRMKMDSVRIPFLAGGLFSTETLSLATPASKRAMLAEAIMVRPAQGF